MPGRSGKDGGARPGRPAPADTKARARPRPPTAAEKLGVKAEPPPKLPVVLKDLEAHPAELKLAQRIYFMRVKGRLSFPEIAEKSASFNTEGKRRKLALGTVWNYYQAYAQVARKYADSDAVLDEIRDVELELAALKRKREKAGDLADYLKLTRAILDFMDMIQGLKGVKQTAPAVVVQQNTYAGMTEDKAHRMFDILEENTGA